MIKLPGICKHGQVTRLVSAQNNICKGDAEMVKPCYILMQSHASKLLKGVKARNICNASIYHKFSIMNQIYKQ